MGLLKEANRWLKSEVAWSGRENRTGVCSLDLYESDCVLATDCMLDAVWDESSDRSFLMLIGDNRLAYLLALSSLTGDLTFACPMGLLSGPLATTGLVTLGFSAV